MSNPLALFPIALAAAKGRIDGLPAASAVAAGFTLLQRSAALVRALAGRRSAILLPPSAAVLTALAASDGRGAVLLPALASGDAMTALLDGEDVGAVFTTSAHAAQLPPSDRAVVLLDGAPRSATVIARGTATTIDLGSHFGLDLEGEEDEGRDEECVITCVITPSAAPHGIVFTHRNLFGVARGAVDATSLLKSDHALALMPPDNVAAFALSFAGPLLAGARASTMSKFDAAEAVRRIVDDRVTHLAGDATQYEAMAEVLEQHDYATPPSALRVCVSLGAAPSAALNERWRRLTTVELRSAHGTPEAPLTLFNAPHFANRPGAIGVPFPGIQVSVRDPKTAIPVSRGQAGFLWVRGTPVVSARLRPSTADGPLRDDWLQTSQRVRERPDGAFEFAD